MVRRRRSVMERPPGREPGDYFGERFRFVVVTARLADAGKVRGRDLFVVPAPVYGS